MKTKNLLIVAFFAIFLFLGLNALREGMPTQKNERVYSLLQKHIPFSLEKRVGGFSILNKDSDVKEKPPAKDVFLRLEQLEQMWGKDFLKIEDNTLIVLDKNKKETAKIVFQSKEEKKWVEEYFKIK